MSKKGKLTTSETEKIKAAAPIIVDSVLLWKYLKQADVAKLENYVPFEVEKYFADQFKLVDYEIELKEACFLDYYVTQYWWAAKQKKYGHEITSAFFSLACDLMHNLKEKKMSFADNVLAYEAILIEANDSKVFPENVIMEINTHIQRTFFQNYRLYQYVIDEKQNDIVIPKEILIECPKPVEQHYPAPLDEAMPAKMHSKFVLKIDDEPKKFKSGTVQEENEDLDNDFEITNEVIDQIHQKFNGISIEDARKIILETTNELVTDLKTDMRNKIKDRETALLNELEKASTSKNSRKK